MIKVNLFVGSRYPVNRHKIKETVEKILIEHNISSAQVDVSIVGARKITTLNEKYLKHQGPTDVLSFPQHDKGQLEDVPMPEGEVVHLGDIVISFPEAVRMAKRFGKMVDQQICFYLEHALLHLLGYHHDDH
ncbi:MAG: putative rRNA maturation factor [Candidatus Pacebacteria bacterium GW2011_GWF2_38_9]|nr:MAG: putative metalloprotease, putative rRNA maturation factor [candidate division TM6 bacterium GW2011_GWF2_28_16]KKQ08524.1 MAG: putative rRNA maturation factor [Candidatus Pacebacteria bacterium GW2011_GWF1_36_5]KKQ88770.1 MAG: putative rRNA maturation factor [Candidatus Pacebacteria bacterium GW2011_GWF2_38_9]HAZ73290.1 rRNA maturation RNase YbeY [Candidatus Paceibacterota bacterium]